MLKIYKENEKSVYLEKLVKRASGDNGKIAKTVSGIISDVRKNGDAALKKYTKKFDGVELSGFQMSAAEIDAGAAELPAELYTVMERAAENIRAFHEKQKQEGYRMENGGKMMGQRVLPLSRVAVYVPGGTAAYPSSVLMNVIPAKVAGVPDIVMATPPKDGGISPAICAAAKIAGVSGIITVGGAQAIAALAYGTESIRRADKIVGPGNVFVAEAKRLVYGSVDIDMIAGPSEVLVIADSTAEPSFVAADLMSQAEHDPLAAAILLTDSEKLAQAVDSEIERQIKKLSRAEIIKKSLKNYGGAVIMPDISSAVKLANEIAPEHLELAVEAPEQWLDKVQNAGSVFLGSFTPEPLGDYYAGPNHVLPTMGSARFASALSVTAFYKRSSYLMYDKESLLAAADDIMMFAGAEGLTAHANSINVRKGRA